MGVGASSRDHYARAVKALQPVKKIPGKEADTRLFAAHLRVKYIRLPAFLDELKRGGFWEGYNYSFFYKSLANIRPQVQARTSDTDRVVQLFYYYSSP